MFSRISLLSIMCICLAQAYVGFDGYILTIENDMVRIKQGAEYVVVCHISRLAIINEKLIVDIAGNTFQVAITPATKQAIVNELERNEVGNGKRAK